FSKSDSFLVVESRSQSSATPKFVELGRTETLQNNENPDWKTTIQLEFNLHDIQELRITLYDSDSDSKDLKKQDKIHECDTITVAELLKKGNGKFTFTWGKESSLTVQYETVACGSDKI